MAVSVSSHRRDGILTVVVGGEVDLSTAPVVEKAITEAVGAAGDDRVQVDLSAVEFLDSSGIALLLKGRRKADEQGVAYKVVGAHGIARQILEITGVWTHLSGESSPSQTPVT